MKKTIQKIRNHIKNRSVIERIINARKIRLEKEWTAFINNNKSEYKLKCRNGFKIRLYKNSELSRLIYQEKFENDIIKFLSTYLKKGDVFIDVGANIGLFSLLAAKVINSEGKVYSFEPCLSTFNKLTENVFINNILNIECINNALSEKEEIKVLHSSLDGFDAWNTLGKYSKSQNYECEEVKTITLDSFMDKINKSVSLIKIDVEGWEMLVIKGAKTILSREDAPTLIIEFDDENAKNSGFNCSDLFDELLNLGYLMFSYNYIDNKLYPHEKLNHYYYNNLIAIKPNKFNSLTYMK